MILNLILSVYKQIKFRIKVKQEPSDKVMLSV